MMPLSLLNAVIIIKVLLMMKLWFEKVSAHHLPIERWAERRCPSYLAKYLTHLTRQNLTQYGIGLVSTDASILSVSSSGKKPMIRIAAISGA
jgi:hypothetical protein